MLRCVIASSCTACIVYVLTFQLRRLLIVVPADVAEFGLSYVDAAPTFASLYVLVISCCRTRLLLRSSVAELYALRGSLPPSLIRNLTKCVTLTASISGICLCFNKSKMPHDICVENTTSVPNNPIINDSFAQLSSLGGIIFHCL